MEKIVNLENETLEKEISGNEIQEDPATEPAPAEADGEAAEEAPAAPAERYRIFLTTHKGLVRDDNEDNFTINTASRKLAFKNINYVSEAEAPLLAAVFDGMGGESKGDYASYISAKTAKRLYTSLKEGDGAPVAEQIAQYVQNANDQIRDFLEENNCRSGGSTVCAVIIRDGVVYPFSLGDSRIYYENEGKIRQLTRDHSLVQSLIDEGKITPKEALNTGKGNDITWQNLRWGLRRSFMTRLRGSRRTGSFCAATACTAS